MSLLLVLPDAGWYGRGALARRPLNQSSNRTLHLRSSRACSGASVATIRWAATDGQRVRDNRESDSVELQLQHEDDLWRASIGARSATAATPEEAIGQLRDSLIEELRRLASPREAFELGELLSHFD